MVCGNGSGPDRGRQDTRYTAGTEASTHAPRVRARVGVRVGLLQDERVSVSRIACPRILALTIMLNPNPNPNPNWILALTMMLDRFADDVTVAIRASPHLLQDKRRSLDSRVSRWAG